MKLVTILSKACHYAQDHIEDDPDSDRELMLQCTSYQIACFLSQNTGAGNLGVPSDIVIEELIATPMKGIKEWEKVLNQLATEMGGWIKEI